MSNSTMLLMLAAPLDKSRRKNQSLPLDAERVTRGQTLARAPKHPLTAFASVCFPLLFYCIFHLSFSFTYLFVCLCHVFNHFVPFTLLTAQQLRFTSVSRIILVYDFTIINNKLITENTNLINNSMIIAIIKMTI